MLGGVHPDYIKQGGRFQYWLSQHFHIHLFEFDVFFNFFPLWQWSVELITAFIEFMEMYVGILPSHTLSEQNESCVGHAGR